MPPRWTRLDGDCKTGPCPTTKLPCAGCSASSVLTARVLVVVDQPASIGALPIAVARDLGIEVAYLPGLAMRRIAYLHPDRPRPTPGTPTSSPMRPAPCRTPCARSAARTRRRPGSVYCRLRRRPGRAVHAADQPAPRRPAQRSPRAGTPAGKAHPQWGVLDLLTIAPTPAALRTLGIDGITTAMAARSPRLAKTLPAQILTALDAQTVTVPGTTEFGRVITGVASQLRDILAERATLAADLETRLQAHPLGQVLTSMPGVGLRTATILLVIVADTSAFRTAAHLAAYAASPPSPADPAPRSRAKPAPNAETTPSSQRSSCQHSPVSPTRKPRLLRPQTSRRQTTQRRPDLPRPPPRRRHVRHAPRPQALPGTSQPKPNPTDHGGLTADIETPPVRSEGCRTDRTARVPGHRMSAADDGCQTHDSVTNLLTF